MAGLTLFYFDYSLLSLSHFSFLISHFLALQPWHSASSFHAPVSQTNLSYICHKSPFTDLHLTLSQIMKSPFLFLSLNSLILWLYDPDLSYQQLSYRWLFCHPVIYLSPELFHSLISFIYNSWSLDLSLWCYELNTPLAAFMCLAVHTKVSYFYHQSPSMVSPSLSSMQSLFFGIISTSHIISDISVSLGLSLHIPTLTQLLTQLSLTSPLCPDNDKNPLLPILHHHDLLLSIAKPKQPQHNPWNLPGYIHTKHKSPVLRLLLDTILPHHAITQHSFFHEYKAEQWIINTIYGNIIIEGSGTVLLHIAANGLHHTFSLCDCLHIPDAPHHGLLSIQHLIDHNYSIMLAGCSQWLILDQTRSVKWGLPYWSISPCLIRKLNSFSRLPLLCPI